jgi:hypothetical protein
MISEFTKNSLKRSLYRKSGRADTMYFNKVYIKYICASNDIKIILESRYNFEVILDLYEVFLVFGFPLLNQFFKYKKI